MRLAKTKDQIRPQAPGDFRKGLLAVTIVWGEADLPISGAPRFRRIDWPAGFGDGIAVKQTDLMQFIGLGVTIQQTAEDQASGLGQSARQDRAVGHDQNTGLPTHEHLRGGSRHRLGPWFLAIDSHRHELPSLGAKPPCGSILPPLVNTRQGRIVPSS